MDGLHFDDVIVGGGSAGCVRHLSAGLLQSQRPARLDRSRISRRSNARAASLSEPLEYGRLHQRK
ncbi:hypothetical protein [Bradyrhizobium japonicum]|uniref:hypothetical protein n=1 Tax=Bradyrhizobium japonicum TaxID=375 RepID=UPI00209D7055|nr:hypothetical protein [Bradyrhizobium japonicum]MCP1778369.1 hypothetical protein [Bradyrhizobium japonicum]MCP1958633.1 hypothetical protein [Bradyrhizobium japonicum]